MSSPAVLAALAGTLLAIGVFLVVAGLRGHELPRGFGARFRRPAWLERLLIAAQPPTVTRRQQQLRLLLLAATATAVWLISGWLVAAIAVAAIGVWLPWLLGSARAAQLHIDQLEAVAAWCRRMSDTLAGGGAMGLAQAIVRTAAHAPAEIAEPVQRLARRMQAGQQDEQVALREFAAAIEDRVGDNVAAALMLALHQQSVGVAPVLRQLADGVARDVRARREVEAQRAEPRQSMRMLLILQVAILVLLTLVPAFAAPYGTAEGQIVMAVLLVGTVVLLVWMRRLAAGRPAPRFLGGRS